MKIKLIKSLYTLACISLIFSNITHANADHEDDNTLNHIQKQWAKINYEKTGEVQKEGFLSLIEEVEVAVNQNPESAALITWSGIIKSTFAGSKGGVGALPYAKDAKKDLETAIAINRKILEGSALASLGTLYYSVPGWPIAFGNKKKAETLLKEALKENPKGIDTNYFYANFLIQKRDYKSSLLHLEVAAKAKPRKGRPLADQGRQKEIAESIKTIRLKLK